MRSGLRHRISALDPSRSALRRALPDSRHPCNDSAFHKGETMKRTSKGSTAVVTRGRPADHQKGHEFQAFNQVVHMPISLSQSVAKKSVENLNQVLADTM